MNEYWELLPPDIHHYKWAIGDRNGRVLLGNLDKKTAMDVIVLHNDSIARLDEKFADIASDPFLTARP